MNTEKRLIEALETMDEREFDMLLGDIELEGVHAGSGAAVRTHRKEIIYMKNSDNKKTGKRSVALAIVLAAAFLVAATAGAMGIGYLVNHKDAVDAYFGAGAGDRIEQQGLFENSELAATEHFKVTKEMTLSAGCVSTVIVTIEATDEAGRDFIAGSAEGSPSVMFGMTQFDGTQETIEVHPDSEDGDGLDYTDFDKPSVAFIEPKITEALGDNLEGWTIRPLYGDGYMTVMFIFEYNKPELDVEVPLELYIVNPAYSGDGILYGTNLDEGMKLCTVTFSTRPNVTGKEFVGETSGREIRLYDYVLLSDQYIPVMDDAKLYSASECPFDVTFEYADGTSYSVTDNDVELMHHFDGGLRDNCEYPVSVKDANGQAYAVEGIDTRLVLSSFIDAQNVEAVVISGERYEAK